MVTDFPRDCITSSEELIIVFHMQFFPSLNMATLRNNIDL